MILQYMKKKDELYKELKTSENGLTEKEALSNIEKYGKNKIEEQKKKSPFMIFLEQYQDLLVIILIVAAVISAFMKDVESCIVILVVITMNAILGTVQTLNAEKSLSNLKKLSSPSAKVIRNGNKTIINSEDVAVGDILVFESGDMVTADGRLIEAASLAVNESALTGESTNVEKSDCDINDETPLAERNNMVYSGSFVTGGRGLAVVTETGMNTEVGKIASMIKNATERKTPLQKVLDNFSKKLSISILVICIIVFLLEIFRKEPIVDAFIFAVALAVAAIPEALGSIVTIVLSYGTQKMANENAIVRKLYAVEGLGSIGIICSDKTGTITQNKMTVRKVVLNGNIINADDLSAEGEAEKRLINAMVLCNDSVCDGECEIGDPTETALINYASKLGLDAENIRETNIRKSEVPFNSDRKLMSTLNGKIMYVKGAADVIIGRITDGENVKASIKQHTHELSKKGLRVLAFAYKETDSDSISEEDENGLKFIGLVAMMDPPRDEAKAAVADCRRAGIKPVMITGDHIVTASAIAEEVGILDKNSKATLGSELDKYTDEELKDFVKDKAVYARVTPEHKIRIVRAWQANGYNVAMTGDGVNDAPALKQADIGVAMGITGTDVSKDASSIILTDDNFATIIKSVKSGRNIYENIKKAILFLLSGNFAGIIAVIFCSVLSLPVPFAAIHLLFINLLTDSLPAIGLGLEPYTDDVMNQKPRKSDATFMTAGFIKETALYGLIISISTIAAYFIGLGISDLAAQTMAFSTLCFSRLWHGFSCKSNKPVIFTKKMFDNRAGILAFVIGTLLLAAVLFIKPIFGIFKIAELGCMEYVAILALSVGSMLVIQIIKMLKK